MYTMMFDHQAGWGEQQNSQRDVFVGFATELGLGVTGTPTFFVNGLPLRAEHDRLVAAIEAELHR